MQKYFADFLVKINNNETISLFDTVATISCMPCMSEHELTLTQTYKVNGATATVLVPLAQLSVL